jgi:hypothetical protein
MKTVQKYPVLHRLFLHLIIFSDKFEFGSKFGQIRNLNENGLDIFRPFSTFNSVYPEFEIRFKPNLAHKKSNFRKIVSFHMISDEDVFYMKIIALDEIYNFLVFSFFI